MLSNQEIALNFIKQDHPEHPLEYVKQMIKPYAYEIWLENVIDCSKCNHACPNKKLLPSGNINAPIMIITTCTIAYIKPVKQFIKQCIDYYKLDPDAFFYVSPVCCTFQEKDEKRLPFKDELDKCGKYHLQELIDIISPLAILVTNSYGSALFSSEDYFICLKAKGIFNCIPIFTAYSVEHIIFLHNKKNFSYKDKQREFYDTFSQMIAYLKEEYPSLRIHKEVGEINEKL